MKEDVIGNKYGHYKVIEELEPLIYFNKKRNKIKKQRLVLCECDCENHTIKAVKLYCLRSGACNSCGCAEHENRSKGKKLPFNRYEIEGDAVKIYLDNSTEYTLIDLCNLEKVIDGHIGKDKKTGYWYYNNGKVRKRLHTMLFGEWVDHKNHDKSNNLKSNIRKCTIQENMRNRSPCKNNKLGVKGVSKTDNKFSAFIEVDGNTLYIGRWDTIEEASHAYDIAAYILFGEFAWYNNKERIKSGNFNMEIAKRVVSKIKTKRPEWLNITSLNLIDEQLKEMLNCS